MDVDSFHFFDRVATTLSMVQWLEWISEEAATFEGRARRVWMRVTELGQRLRKLESH